MPTRLSSRLTFLQKIVVPAIGAALTVAALVNALPQLLEPDPPPGAVPGAIAVVVLVAAFTAVAIAESRKLKQVHADNRGLLVSNYRREIRIPYEAIAGVTERTRQGNGQAILRLKQQGPFGMEVRILLPFRLVLRRPVRSEHPIVGFLRSRGVPVVDAEPRL